MWVQDPASHDGTVNLLVRAYACSRRVLLGEVSQARRKSNVVSDETRPFVGGIHARFIRHSTWCWFCAIFARFS